MTSHGQRRPVTSREFNRLLFALVLLASLAVLARMVTRQESHAEGIKSGEVTQAEWVRTADALFLRGEWEMAADAYLGALETARTRSVEVDVRVYRKLAESLWECGERRSAAHFLRKYQSQLFDLSSQRVLVDYAPEGDGFDREKLTAELAQVDAMLLAWNRAR